MSHFGGASIRPLCDKRDSQGLLAMVARDFHRIFIGILDILLFDPKELFTFRAFLHKHGHNLFSIVPDSMNLFNILIAEVGNY